MENLIELEEKRGKEMKTLEIHYQYVKKNFDKKAKAKISREGDLVLKWDVDREKAGRHSKFDALWSAPYVIISCKQSNAFQLSKSNGEVLPIPIIGIHLKTYF